MDMTASLVMWSFEQTFVPHPKEAPYEIWHLIGPMVSEDKIFKASGRQRTTTTYDGGLPIL